ncbi:MAG TPA: Pycsar system effector family protein, partial [Arachidicoccus sp.]
MDYTDILKNIQAFMNDYFQSHNDSRYVYHNQSHTQGVVNAAIQIAIHYQLNEKDSFIVTAAAWFHDSGYFTQPENHEVAGARLAEEFLKSVIIDESIINAVKGCIIATHMPQNPQNQLEQIVCDADLFHLGTIDFPEKNKLMRKEAELFKNEKIDKDQWRKGTILLMETHHYFTDYCQSLLNNTKALNLQRLKEKEQEQKAENKMEESTIVNGEILIENKDKKNKKDKDKRPDRGIETMFKVISSNNQRLSNMADNKAHIMISVNSIILSAIISLILKNLHDHQFLAIPTFMILTVGLLTIIFSVLATRPSIPKGTFSEEDIEKQRVNLLFFGNFYKMTLQQYTDGMLQVMEDRGFLYGSLIKDVYFQGVVLGKKYHLLRLSYNVFM